MLFSAIILSSTTVIIGCLVVLITESLYNLLYNLPSAPPEMGGLLGQSKNTINTIFVDSGKISFRKSCQYVPNELLLNQTISDWDAQGIIFKGIFHTHKEGHGCQCLSSADIVYIRSIATVYKGNIIKNLIMDCQSYTKYRPNETTGGIFVSWRRKEELPTGA